MGDSRGVSEKGCGGFLATRNIQTSVCFVEAEMDMKGQIMCSQVLKMHQGRRRLMLHSRFTGGVYSAPPDSQLRLSVPTSEAPTSKGRGRDGNRGDGRGGRHQTDLCPWTPETLAPPLLNIVIGFGVLAVGYVAGPTMRSHSTRKKKYNGMYAIAHANACIKGHGDGIASLSSSLYHSHITLRMNRRRQLQLAGRL